MRSAPMSSPVMISSQSSNPDVPAFNQLKPQFIGDYISAVADSSQVYAVWTNGHRLDVAVATSSERTLGTSTFPQDIANDLVS